MQANSGELFKIFSILDIWEQTSGARIVGHVFVCYCGFYLVSSNEAHLTDKMILFLATSSSFSLLT